MLFFSQFPTVFVCCYVAVFKYKKDTDASLGDKLAKLNLHSLKKKSSRIRERFSANLGIIDQTKDANFDKAEAKFRQIEKTVKVFVRNVQSYMEEIQVRHYKINLF